MTKSKARTFGQDLMRGEHKVGEGKKSKDWRDQGGTVKGNLWHGGESESNQKVAAVTSAGTSIFDPVLCELSYRWYCPPGGRILDPFAGGSVRGIVAARLGFKYVGIDLSRRQVEANKEQAGAILAANDPQSDWYIGDSRDMDSLLEAEEPFDFIFSCPPYYDLELYSDDPRDLSNMSYAEFLTGYERVIRLAADRLKDDRFACFVVGDIRDKDGLYRGFPGATVEAFKRAGLGYYNEAVLVTATGSLPIRVGRQFTASRKLGKTHQNVLVFVKGSGKRATAAIGETEFLDPAEFTETDFGERMTADDLPGGD